jgi:hypothetical protein
MSIDLSFGSYTIPTYIYEPFSYTISNPGPYTLTVSNTPGIPPGYIVNNGSNVVFSTSSNGMGVGSELFVITARDGSNIVATSSNTVTIGAGRFLDASGASYDGRSFTFYKNEPITPIVLVAPFAVSTPTTVPTLPPGLSYISNDSNRYSIAGTPLVTVPQSNYLAIGKGAGSNLGKTVTSQFGISVSNERVNLNLVGSPIVSPMTVGTPISARTITAAYPPYPFGGTLRYTWFGVPDGITVTNSAGTVQLSPFTPADLSSTLIIQGTPSIAAANAFKNAGISSNTVTFVATRTNPLPQISNTQAITFGFGETVLFDPVTVPTLYSGVALDPSAISFRAQTYFGSGSAISNIFSPNLRSDLSINFVVAEGRGYLTGTPTATGTATYTIRAINSNAISQDLAVPITVTTDTATFVTPPTPAVDVCYNFVLSRPISLGLSGYYSSNIEFRAIAASSNAINFTSSGLTGTGLSLSNVGSNTVRLVGTPSTVTTPPPSAPTTATITASAVGTPATASTTFKFAILDDVITFSQPTPAQLSFIQNRPITPIQLTATTLSDRPVISFLSTNMPTGMTISSLGLITGTPTGSTNGSFTVTASTGYTSQNKIYSYTLVPDSIILIERPEPSYALTLGGPIPAATVSGLSYSGTGVSNFVFSNLPQTYGMTIGNATGVFGGTLTTSLPPDPVLPSNVSFSVYASAGLLTAGISAELNTLNAAQDQWFVLAGKSIGNTVANLNSWTTVAALDMSATRLTDYSIRPYTVDTRSIAAVTGTREVFQTETGTSFTKYLLPYTEAANPTYGTVIDMGPRAIVRNPTTPSTLYGVGYDGPELIGEGIIHIGAFWKSLDNGVTWSSNYPILVTGGGQTGGIVDAFSHGNAIAYKSGILLIGGEGGFAPGPTTPEQLPNPSIARSTDFGETWTAMTDPPGRWVNQFNVDATRWVVIGSDSYIPNQTFSTGFPSGTIRYSDDQGLTWSAATGGPNYIGELLTYGNGTWIAGGQSWSYTNERMEILLAGSTNGATWTTFTLSDVYPINPTFYPEYDEERSSRLDSILYDGTNYVIIITNIHNPGSSPYYYPYIHTHPADGSSLSSGWSTPVLSSTLEALAGSALVSGLKGRYTASVGGPAQPVLSFPTQASNGPMVTSPTNRSIVLYQYAPMTPIQFTATGTGTIYFFVRDTELPRGLTFNQLTNTLSGTPMLLGNSTVTFYVKDDNGVTLLNFEIRVIVPTIDRQQTSAGAWTSLVRQYTVVNAAQNSLNGRALPATDPPLGEFLRPYPPDESNDTACKKC